VHRKIRFMQHEIAERMKGLEFGPGDVVIDLGANIGLFSEPCLARGARVVAYEPDPECFAALLKLKERYPDFEPHNAAVGRVQGTAELFRHENYNENKSLHAESSSLIQEKDNIGSDSITVAVNSIEAVLASHDFIDILKIDIEGSEYDIYEPIIGNCHKIGKVLMETHEKKVPGRMADHLSMVAEIERRGLQDKFLLDWF